jgi:type IV pilus assembly protein PilO
MDIKLNTKNLPLYAKVLIAVLPAVILSVAIIMLVILPKQKEIKALDAKIDTQNNEIAASEAKVAKLDILKEENERLINRINELKEQLPEEKEISSLLKQVSDLGIAAGLNIKSWKPGAKTTHSSGIVYEIPVSVDVDGTYHNLGYFLSSLTRLNRIVNISNMKLGSPKIVKGDSLLGASFKASTFSAIPEAEEPKAADKAGKKAGKKR